MNHSGLDLFDEIHDRIDVVSKDGRRQAILHAVGELKRLVETRGCRD